MARIVTTYLALYKLTNSQTLFFKLGPERWPYHQGIKLLTCFRLSPYIYQPNKT
ncbi:hypothetical protein DSUL_50296 [Desulfovibrionales bacterium]